ncbi:MAG: hypothetical protein ACI8Z7_000684 [Candidatus Nanohaloarchaea archaeon]|jgi:hypothetical protein
MVKRKGAGYMIEVMTALLVMFGFILGNTPSDPATDWSEFQKEVIAQDTAYVLEKTGDMENFVRGGETGSIITAGEALSRDRVTLSGTVESVPIATETVGFHIREVDRLNDTVEHAENLGDTCHQNDDLRELEDSDTEILRSENPRAGAHVYVTDSDPSISGGTNGEVDYDTVWVDNGTRCQFSSAEGPYYRDEFLYWGDGPGGDYWDFNQIYYSSSSEDGDLELYNSTQVVRLKRVLEDKMNGIDTKLEISSMAADREDLESYDILVFREEPTLDNGVLDDQPEKIKNFMSDGSVLMMMNLERENFFDASGDLRDNFLTDTGLKWVDLPYRRSYRSGTSIGGSFTEESESGTVETFFKGVNGDLGDLNLTPSGNISSSNSQKFKRSEPLLSTDRGTYDLTAWNVTNYSMEELAPQNIDGVPNTDCVQEGTVDGNLTRGTFSFQNYSNSEQEHYTGISTKLGEDDQFCRENSIRAFSIDRDKDGDFESDSEGPFLNGESFVFMGKRYTTYFPGEEAIDNGTAVELIYTGDSSIETVNYRTSFRDFPGDKLARIGYKENYNTEEKKMISSVIHWLSEDSAEFGIQEETGISTENVGGVKENTFMPYRVSLRWR